ncbi:hypothetical protein [Tenacibaculum amylolyticum]|uniref:hypothetical protein n=1 Tax=Tenacibaculum amylolyticum TaxID=104269 RepID=UPI0038943F6D
MRILSFKITVLLICGVIQLQAQQSKTHKEEFKVDKDVTIDIDTRHADIIIETWNKNKVVVEACMTVEGEDVSEERKEELFNNWDFEALGNKSQIDIKSRTNAFIDINTFDFDEPNYAIYTDDLVDFSLGTLDVLDSVDFIMPPLPSESFVVMPDIEIDASPFIITEFDFDAYKNDKDYLNKWKEENKTLFGKNIDVTIGDNSIAIVGDDTNVMMLKEKKKYEKEIAEAKKLYNKERKNAMKAYKKAKEQLMKKRKKAMKERKEALKKRKVEAVKSRKAIQKLLKSKLKQKVKRTIKIKAPKDAKFHMNVKYGALSFSK